MTDPGPSTPVPTDGDAADPADASVLARTRVALTAAIERRDSGLLLFGVALGYLCLYLVTVGDLSLVGRDTGTVSIRTAADLSRAVARLGFLRFGAIAVVSAGPVTYLFAPLNVLVGTVLALLVGANAALTYLGVVQPRACGLESSTGILAGVPALLSGAACCGPTILLVVGIQASAALVAAFQLLVPVAVVLLVAGLLLVGRRIDPALV
ncbi:hypothetical protein SAMN05192561_1015 [Halopenitus malekzadehii]|uniref:Uncharacterized protein n=1 Tax=Halopenitus malekzadehii TaxID=1267564 RepID=A0A1H6HLU9_9EURY|nr:hypothetical protein [Halopenitus malekzadehii]SEH36466.1 hypothetical protein SAMN05192561_1015 [Halopenitus malekzadehii]